MIGGFLQFAPALAPADDVARAGRSADRRGVERAGVAIVRRSRSPLGAAGIAVAWVVYAATAAVPAPAARCKLFEKKFYWDELYDLVWYRHGDLVARGLYALRRARR